MDRDRDTEDKLADLAAEIVLAVCTAQIGRLFSEEIEVSGLQEKMAEFRKMVKAGDNVGDIMLYNEFVRPMHLMAIHKAL